MTRFRVDAEFSQPDTAGLSHAQDELLFQQFRNLFFGDARNAGDYLKVAQAIEDFGSGHFQSISYPERRRDGVFTPSPEFRFVE